MSTSPPDSFSRITVVVPVLNAMRFLPRTIPSFLNAAGARQGVEIICVDNGSTDGSLEYLSSLASSLLQLERREGVSISAMRNFAASLGDGDFLSFLDADCSVGPQYFADALAVLSSTGATATGCQYDLPTNPHWIEATWHTLHYIGHPYEARYLPAGNFIVRRKEFEEIGGFREDLLTGEDAELGQRLRRAGYRIYSTPAVGAVHLGNPKSIRAFYRRNVWHGLGMFGTVNVHELDRPTTMTLIHAVASIGGLVVLAGAPGGWALRSLGALGLQLLVPAGTVAYRIGKTRRTVNPLKAIGLYWFYYWARVHAVTLIVLGKINEYKR